jgi:hypothetical protein
MPKNNKNPKTRRGRPSGTSRGLVQNDKELSPQAQLCPMAFFKANLSRGMTQRDLHTIVMHQDGTVTTDATGTFALTFGNAPASYAGWTNLANEFDEFRVLGMRTRFLPIKVNGGSLSTTFAPFVTAIDYDTATALSSYAAAAAYSSCREHTANTAWQRNVVMSGSENSGYINTASGTTNTFYVKSYSTGNSFSTAIGHYLNDILVQLRARGA